MSGKARGGWQEVVLASQIVAAVCNLLQKLQILVPVTGLGPTRVI